MPLFPKLQRKFGITALLRFAAAFFVVRLVLLLLAPSGGFLYLAAVAQFASSGILLPAIVYYVAETLTPEQQTNGQGMIHLAGYCLGPALITLGVGAVVDGSGIQAALGVMIALAAVGTVLMAADLDNDTVVANVVADEKIARYLENLGGSIVKTIVVKNKLVNLIVK